MTKRILIISSIIIFSLSINNTHGQLKCHRTFTADQLNEDLHLLTSKLQAIHPDLYRVTPKHLLDERISGIQHSIRSSNSYLEFLKLIAPLFTDIGDISTQWGHAPDYIKFRNENIPIFPLQIKIQNNRFFVRHNFSNHENITPGAEILILNGDTPDEYLERNYPLLPTDGKIKSIQHRWLETYFPQHHSNFWEQPDTFNLVLKDKDGKIYNRSVPAVLKKDIQANRNTSNTSTSTLAFYVSGNTGVLTIPSFNEKNIDSWEIFIDSCFTVLKTQKVKNLILNLKGEGRGNLYYGSILYSYLKTNPSKYAEEIHSHGDSTFKYIYPDISYDSINNLSILLTTVTAPKNNSFNGALYVITDGWTTNSRGFFCARVRERPNTFFVGEECGSSTFGINEFPISLTLPNTGIQIHIPTVQIEIDGNNNHASVSGVRVDFPLDELEDEKVISKTFELIKIHDQ